MLKQTAPLVMKSKSKSKQKLIKQFDLNLWKMSIVTTHAYSKNSLRHIFHKLSGISFVVGSSCFNDLRSFFNSEVLVRVCRIDVLFVQVKYLIVRNHTRIHKVLNSSKTLPCHVKRCRKHFSQNGNGVGDVYNAFILNNVGNKVTVDKIIWNRHSHPC